MDIWGLAFVVIIPAVGSGGAEELFSAVWVLSQSMDLECISALTHSKYGFIVGSPTPRLFFLFSVKYIWPFYLDIFVH